MLVPVDTISMTVLYCMPEMKVKIQNIEVVVTSQGSTVEVPLNHIPSQCGCEGLELSRKMQLLRGSSTYQPAVPSPVQGDLSLASGSRKPPVTRSPRGIAMFHTSRQESGNTWSMRTNTRSKFSR